MYNFCRFICKIKNLHVLFLKNLSDFLLSSLILHVYLQIISISHWSISSSSLHMKAFTHNRLIGLTFSLTILCYSNINFFTFITQSL